MQEDPLSFSVDEEQQFVEFFQEHGYVVVRDILTPEEVSAAVDEIWNSPSLLGSCGARRDAPETWGEGWPASCTNMLESKEQFGEVETWRHRVNPSLLRVFARLLGDDRIWVSIDRLGVMRPTLVPDGRGGSQARPEWRTRARWLHWDQNPHATPGFKGLQGLLTLSDHTATSGGFVTVPGFHRKFAEWAEAHPEGSVEAQTRNHVPFNVPSDDPLQDQVQRILAPPGALVLWDSRMPHQNVPNEGSTFRMVQYITCDPVPSKEEEEERQKAWQLVLSSGLVPREFGRWLLDEGGVAAAAALGMVAQGEGEEQAASLAQLRALLATESPPEAPAALEALREAQRLEASSDPADIAEAATWYRRAFKRSPLLELALNADIGQR